MIERSAFPTPELEPKESNHALALGLCCLLVIAALAGLALFFAATRLL